MTPNPFEALGLPARPDLTDEDVRGAWRAIAAATHPDRADGGDAARYTAATAAYAMLRTPWGRSEAWADLEAAADITAPQPPLAGPERVGPERARSALSRLPAAFLQLPAAFLQLPAAFLQLPGRIRRGRPVRLLLRAAVAVLLSLAVLGLIPGQPAAPALVSGLIAWFAFTCRSDLAPPPDR